jgi:SAM-dependent methyltransferase
MDPLEHLNSARAKYARDWSEGDAAFLEQAGHYQWMRTFVAGNDRVVEVGCGDGRSTHSLLEDGHSVVTIDENPYCIEAAYNRLQLKGHSVAAHDREALTSNGMQYVSSYASVENPIWPAPGAAVLVTGHIFADPPTEALLRELAPVDGIVCWLIGSHTAVALNAQTSGDQSQHMYRLRVQNKLYELADDILRPGGALHIVDRIDPLQHSAIGEVVEGHRDQASVTSLVVGSHEIRNYQRPRVTNQIAMVRADQQTDTESFTLISILSHKPE